MKAMGEIGVGDIVWLRYPDGEIIVVQIVLPGETMFSPETTNGITNITTQSPVAQAILGKNTGDRVFVQTPMGTVAVDILVVMHSPATVSASDAASSTKQMLADMVAAFIVTIGVIGYVLLYLASVPMPWEGF